MADHDIQNSQHLLKRLKEDMEFLDRLMKDIQNISSQTTSLTSQVRFVASNLHKTWSSIHVAYENWRRETEEL